ncbi:MAG: RNA pyrophosphohydrolase [Alphaproteobacteria bacterium]|nr:RNA pyrophosphohydrolase [Alphaproteobacteria bacterium]
MAKPANGSLPYRRGVGIMVLNRDGRILVARRIDMPSEAWQMPQGGIDRGETPIEAARRELLEEIGTANGEFVGESRDWYSYDLPPDLAGRLWRGRFRGQTQKWFAFRFAGDDREINLETEKPEFLAWKWAPADDVPRLIVPFKRDIYAAIVSEFSSYIVPRP